MRGGYFGQCVVERCCFRLACHEDQEVEGRSAHDAPSLVFRSLLPKRGQLLLDRSNVDPWAAAHRTLFRLSSPESKIQNRKSKIVKVSAIVARLSRSTHRPLPVPRYPIHSLGSWPSCSASLRESA